MASSKPRESSLRNIIKKKSFKWIFVGGKGGVGKTVCSIGIALQLAKLKKNVLIISTDPAHSLSDAFNQKFTKVPTLVNGYKNLFAMEVDPNIDVTKLPENNFGGDENVNTKVLQELIGGLPAVNEALSYFEVIKPVKDMEFASIVFDTAPTGDTLRLLSLPQLIKNGFNKLSRFKSILLPIMATLVDLFGTKEFNADLYTATMDEVLAAIKELNKQFRDPNKTTFVCVCIADFLSLYETERLVQQLGKYEINTRNIVVNQLISKGGRGNTCELSSRKYNIQQKYLQEIYDLYEDCHITRVPLSPKELRGIENIKTFSEHLVKPYKFK